MKDRKQKMNHLAKYLEQWIKDAYRNDHRIQTARLLIDMLESGAVFDAESLFKIAEFFDTTIADLLGLPVRTYDLPPDHPVGRGRKENTHV